jgi:NAD(P) transhydrogenase
MDRYDLIVIGSGPAGEKGAAKAAYFGKRVAIVETAIHVGGAGVNTGTIPSKALRETALYFSGLRQRGLYGIDYQLKGNLRVEHFLFREQQVVQSLRHVVQDNIQRHRITLINGDATFDDPHRIRVVRPGGADLWLEGDVILIATGSVPNRGCDIPFYDRRIYDSDTILSLDAVPRRLGVVGAGVIGCEYTTIFAALGTTVILIDERPQLLSILDAEISGRLRDHMRRLGVDVRVPEAVTDIRPDPKEITLTLGTGETVGVDSVLFAAGRNGNTARLGLERVGIATGPKGHIRVNQHYQTDIPHIYAAGDVIGAPGLAATSMEQARVAMGHAFDLEYRNLVPPVLPVAVYTIPEVAMAGDTEETCQSNGIAYTVGRALYRHNARGQIIGEIDGMLKLVVRNDDRSLIGVHIVGEGAPELIHVGLVVMQARGTFETFLDTVFNYPSLGDAYKYAAYDALGRLESSRVSPSERA